MPTITEIISVIIACISAIISYFSFNQKRKENYQAEIEDLQDKLADHDINLERLSGRIDLVVEIMRRIELQLEDLR